MADEIKLQLTLETKQAEQGFKKIEESAEDASKAIEKDLKSSTTPFTEELKNLSLQFGLVAGAIGTVGVSIKKAFDFALLGEATKAVETRFNALASSANIAADSLRVGIETATQGLIDDEDALQIATKGIVAFGEEAARLPQVLDLARVSSQALGLDIKESFESLSTFIQTGSERVLRQFGIVLDLDKAYKEAAKSIGVTTQELTETQKQTVRLNALLGDAANKFTALSQSATPLRDEIQRLNVALGNLSEDSAKKFNDVFGPALQRIVTSITNLVKTGPTLGEAFNAATSPLNFLTNKISDSVFGFDKLSLSADDLKKKISETTDEITKLENQAAQLGKIRAEAAAGDASTLSRSQAGLDQINKQISEARRNLTEFYKLLSAKIPSSEQGILPGTDQASNQRAIQATEEQIAARQQKESALTQFLLQEELKRIQNSIQIKQIEQSQAVELDQQLLVNKQIQNLQLQAQEVQQQISLAGIKKQFVGTDATIEAERNQAIQQSAITNEQVLTRIKNQGEADRLALKKKFAQQELQATSNALAQIATLQENASGELATVGKAAAITKATIDGYLAVQNALAQVPYPFNFAAAALVGVAAAANVSKIASTGPGGGSSAFDAGGGGIAATPSPTTELVPPSQIERDEPQTAVQLIVQGDIFDSDSTATRLTDLLNDAFDKKGVVIQRGAFA